MSYKNKYHPFIFLCVLLACAGCSERKEEPALFDALDSKVTGLEFANKLTPAPDFNMFKYMYFYNGVIREHVHGDNFRLPVVVSICHIYAHGELADVIGTLRQYFPETAVALVDIQVIVLMKIIPDIQVRIAVEVNIRNADTKPIPDDRAVDASCPGNICKGFSIIAEYPVACQQVVAASIRSTVGECTIEPQ